jgi:N-acetylglucosaminyldiphosphoundecaprenol N-acetyl-beta-D-mannosaminyltransferase
MHSGRESVYTTPMRRCIQTATEGGEHNTMTSAPLGSRRQQSDRGLPVAQIGPATVHAITEADCVDYVLAELACGRGGWILTLNLDDLRLLVRDPTYADLCARATLVVADGMPILWASRLQGTPLPGRVAGSDLISSLTAAAATQARSICLLGGTPGTAAASAALLQRRHPHLHIVGTLCPNPGFETDAQEVLTVMQALRAAAPDIVFVGLPKPKREWLIDRARTALPGIWFVGVGVAFSFLSGELRRAPAWMQHSGLEWLHRLTQEPGRLAKRYLVDDLPTAVALLARAVGRHRHRRESDSAARS